MNSTYITTISSIVALAAALIPVVGFLAIWIRTGSLQLPLSRLWQFVLGSQEIQDTEIKRLINEQNDLMRFRLAFGINVATMADCRQLQDWAKTHALEMGQVGACGRFFNVERFEPKLPSQFFAYLRFTILMVSLFALVPVPLLMTHGSALAKLKESGRWILLDESSARAILPLGSESLTRASCSKGDTAADWGDAFTHAERTILCRAFGSEAVDAPARAKVAAELAAFVQDALWAQRLGLLLVAGTCILCAVLCTRWLAAFDAARRLERRLERGAERQTPGADTGAAPPDRVHCNAADAAGPHDLSVMSAPEGGAV